MSNNQIKYKDMKKKVSILIILFAFFFSGSALADPSVDVRIANRSFKGNAKSGTLTFDVELKAGTNYRLNGAADGDWTGMAIRIDIHGEPGLTYNVPPPATPTTHDMASMNVSPTGVTYGEYNRAGTYGNVTNTVAVIATRISSKDDVAADLNSTWVRVATISIPVTGGVPTDKTLLMLRNTDRYLSIRSAFWSNGANFTVRRPLSLTAGATDNQAIAYEDKIWAFNDEVYIQSNNVGGIIRIYSMDGALCKQQTITTEGITKIKLSSGIYAVSINNDTFSSQNIVRIK